MANTELNAAASQIIPAIRSGKDGGIYNEKGKLLVSVEQYQSEMNVSNTKVQPCGSAQEFEKNTGYGITLSFTEFLIEDGEYIEAMIEYQRTGIPPKFTYQGVIIGNNGSEERMIYPDCIPSGKIDLQNVSAGDLIKRAWSMYCNGKVTMQGKLTR